ncbi:CocE/NonD family hydrolase [Novosphingobium mangrovi (ex Huang et al. 2023)]|uniref:CocE/NonD family hydrolase n=1 Tax=Novosphingobium mangrovi (ex Huang et al. 2023) TaxID=2976432 RepID=A0ABT2I4B2_9SPHN|nr:CocE/NonD family hydrolase [Novosphingobium mangrovi (ex Huang et al. 2023)]MCT2399637.1 CocE/NonD family hydrolase [Novosphingobium mangrovi (ex Huang et al. 2023)]
MKHPLIAASLVLALTTTAAIHAAAPTDTMINEQVESYDWVLPQADFVRREVMVPMRDGTKLYTVIVFRKGAKDGPILLSRTPYDAQRATTRNRSQKIEEILPVMDKEFVDDGYIRVYQDVRGLGKSEGDYVMNRPLRGPLNKTSVDHATDAYDTIDWLVKNVPESNGKVGITGSSYLGFTSLMALIDPHPALKAAVPQSPMVDGWMGDDWFHNGAFRTFGFDYDLEQTVKSGGGAVPKGTGDEYTAYLKAGSAMAYAKAYGLLKLPIVRKMLEHPSYDAWWQGQAVDKLLAKRKLTVPTMLLVGQWDQEDSYGAPAVYKALEPQDTNNDMVSLVIGPWRHSQVNYEARALGPLKWEGDTGLQFRTRYMKPFLDCHLKTHAPKCDTPPVLTYATGTNRWEVSQKWPAGDYTPLYLGANSSLSFSKPGAGSESYVSDPAKPVPMLPRPIHMSGDEWRTWLVQDQRFVDGRPDVMSYTTGVLDKPVHIKGAPKVELHAATTGQDSDYVVKLIDVYPEENSADPVMGGYELALGIEIFRGRYVHGFSTSAPLEPGKTYAFKWDLPNVDHVFLPGHRIMVQVQSSLFPLYDRNPQTWVPSIMEAMPKDYVKATETVHYGGDAASAVWLPVAKD